MEKHHLLLYVTLKMIFQSGLAIEAWDLLSMWNFHHIGSASTITFYVCSVRCFNLLNLTTWDWNIPNNSKGSETQLIKVNKLLLRISGAFINFEKSASYLILFWWICSLLDIKILEQFTMSILQYKWIIRIIDCQMPIFIIKSFVPFN